MAGTGMQQEVDQIVQAILVASDPLQTRLHQEALEYINTVQQNSNETWRLALNLFVDVGPDGQRKYPTQARFFALRVLDDFLANRYEPLDDDTFKVMQRALVSYIETEYVLGPSEASAPFLRNKFSHTLTLFFLCTYLHQWPTFFMDFFSLIQPHRQSSSSLMKYNPHISLLLFHLVLEISGEVADQILKAARMHSIERQTRDGKVRDTVRERDAANINEAVLTIVADSASKMGETRKGNTGMPMDQLTEVVDWGIRTFGSYVGWIDINLTVTPTTIAMLFSLLDDPSLPIRLASSGAVTRMVSKGLKEPEDKLKLIKVLALGQVLEVLEGKTKREQIARGEDVDEGEETYRESLGRLLNTLGLELAKLAEDDTASTNIRLEASALLEQLLPVMLRFLADAYDDTSCTVFPMLSNILISYKKTKRSAPHEITDSKRAFLSSTLDVILQKLKWALEDDPDDMDEDDKHAFESLRKGDLRGNLDSILTIDQDLVINVIKTLVLNTFAAYESGVELKWNDLELAIYLVYIFGEVNKSGGKGRTAFCQTPMTVAKDLRKVTDYSDFPLTPHGEMLFALVRSGVSSYNHPTVTMQFFETCARYGDFFKVRKQCILPLLEAMLDNRGLHHPSRSVRSRLYYLFCKFVREDRNEIPLDLVGTLLSGFRDSLNIEVELPIVETTDPQEILMETIQAPGLFDSQLNLFEAAGILISLTYKTPDQSEALLLSIVKPLLDDLTYSLRTTVRGPEDIVPVVKVHHIIMALGNIAKGYPDVPSPIPDGYIMPPIPVFQQMAQTIIVSLDAMNVFKVVREATRFAFARLVATTGSSITHFIPALMQSLLAHFDPTELVDFMSFIGLLMHRLQLEMADVLDQLIGPLSLRIMELLSQPITGTDDKVAQTDAKKGYLNFLNNIMVNKLHTILISERNKPRILPLIEDIVRVAQDTSDPASEKLAFAFLGRCVTVWDGTEQQAPKNGDGYGSSENLLGFSNFVQQELIPLAFQVPSMPGFNIKDGQMLVVLHEVAAFLQTICRAQGQVVYNYLLQVFLPSQGWPPETALEFVTNLRDLDGKGFRKYFTDFVRASRS